MPDFRTYWQQKEAKLRENWDARYKSFIAKHCSLEEIRETVFRPADYAWNFAGQESFLSTHFTAANPMADHGLVGESLATDIDRALSTLSTREKEILQRFYGIGTREMTLEEIGDEYGLTRERVRQIKEKALRGLRKSSRSEILKPYL